MKGRRRRRRARAGEAVAEAGEVKVRMPKWFEASLLGRKSSGAGEAVPGVAGGGGSEVLGGAQLC